LVMTETAKATTLVEVTVGNTIGAEADWLNPASLMTKKPKTKASVMPKAHNPRRERRRRE
jgi:hypothetical protein